MTITPALKDIRALSLEELTAVIKEGNFPAYRAKQIFEWIWKKQKTSFEDLKNLPEEVIDHLKSEYCFRPVTVEKTQFSSDGTIKSRLQLHDGHFIEAVLIPVLDDNRFTVCVSSQVGCSLTCSFCATGKMKRIRNIEAPEIFDQVAIVNRQCQEAFGKGLTNIVYMGMGEPLLAYNNVLLSIKHITSEYGMFMSSKRITVSTVGIAKMIKKLADYEVKFNLALSLHAPDDEKRSSIMPINETNDLASLMEAITYYYQKTKNRISYEYIAFEGFNDTQEDAKNLVKLCRHFPVRVNIIEYNKIDGAEFAKSNGEDLDDFVKYLTNKDVTVTVRRSRGKDIDAACGQLANKG